MGEIKKGDHVRVTIEGPVTYVSDRWITVGDIDVERLKGTTVEKIEPPVEVFKPGDVVRRKSDGVLATLSDTGFTNLGTGVHHEYGSYGPTSAPDGRYLRLEAFTSDDWEKVSIE